MANQLYPLGRQRFLSASINMSSDTIKVAMVNTGTYTVNFTTDEFWSTPSSALVGTAATLGSKTITNGTFNAANVTYSAVTGAAVGALILYKDTGSAGTSPLIAYIDTATGLPVTPNGGDITVTWDTGSNKIFTL